jgi:hypothetical protein
MSADAPISKDDRVARYNCTSGGAQFCQGCYQMERDEYGDYVRFADYERLTAERDQYKQRLTEAQQLAIRQGNQLRQMAGAAMRKQS